MKIILTILVSLFVLSSRSVAQNLLPLVDLPMSELLQYQVRKSKQSIDRTYFKRYKLQPIHTEWLEEKSDKSLLWGWHVKPNLEYNSSSDPLYKLFAKVDNASLAIVDYATGSLEIIFWDKAYYLRFIRDLYHYGYFLSKEKPQQNVLRFINNDVSIGVDAIIWSNLYVLSLFTRQ